MDSSLLPSEAYREIFQSMSEGIIMVDEKGEIAIANPVAEQLFGYNHNELNGKFLENLLPDRFRKGHMNFRMAFNTDPHPRKMGLGRDLVALKKNGTEFPVEISLSYTRMNGNLLVMAFISDISQRKKTEDALKQSEEQLIVYATELEKKVELRTEALNASVNKLEREVQERKKAEEEAKKSLEKERELNELKTKFVSIASHEFRTPLSTILSSTSLIKQYSDKGEMEKAGKHIQRIKSSVNHLTMILNDLLSVGKLEEGNVKAQPESIHIKEFFNEVFEEVQPLLKEGQVLELQGNTNSKSIESDPRILRNIMFNLISNASKYSHVGKKISLICSQKDSHIRFTVKDEGIGILKEEQKHLFDRFFRASNAGNIQGTGLGLNIVKRYAELLKGTVTFESEYGVGSSFTLDIPIK
ncbi:MAG: PAS domain S-box protein [Bacteroidetes bacterium]|nr:PAS domain S-box protein [Bacteroidota bacterium]